MWLEQFLPVPEYLFVGCRLKLDHTFSFSTLSANKRKSRVHASYDMSFENTCMLHERLLNRNVCYRWRAFLCTFMYDYAIQIFVLVSASFTA